MSFDPSRLVSQLSALDKEEGDIRLKCQGDVVKAHSFVLSMRSKYFETALKTSVGDAKSKTEMNVEDCSLEVLTCAVNFMYGIPIPEDFADTQGLLHQADFFMMEDLKTAVGFLIAKTLSLDTVSGIAPLAEKYREVTLQEICGDFILAHIEELEEKVISELALFMPSIAGKALHTVQDLKKELALAKSELDDVEEFNKLGAEDKDERHKRALARTESKSKNEIAEAKLKCAKEIQETKEKEEKLNSHIQEIGLKVLGIHMYRNQFKQRVDFPSCIVGTAEYKAYVKGNIEANMLVRCCQSFSGISNDGYASQCTARVGDIGRIINPQLSGVQVKWQNGVTIKQKDCFAYLELLTKPLNTSFLA